MLKRVVIGQVINLAMTHVDDNGKRVDLTGATSLVLEIHDPSGAITGFSASIDPEKNWRTFAGQWTPIVVGEHVLRSRITLADGTKIITRDQHGRFEVVDG